MHGIKVLDRLIVCETKQGEEYYLIENGKIARASVEEKEPVRINLQNARRNLPAVRKEGIFSRVREMLKRSMNKGENAQEGNSENYYENQEDKGKEFRENLSDMTRYDENIYEEPDTVISKKTREEER